MINIKENKELNTLNHSCAHLMAQAIKHLYPNAKFWVGPVIESGFYYDIDLSDIAIKEDDLLLIEKEMKKISKDGKRITRHEITREEALKLFNDDEYKIDLINNMDDDQIISCYTQGDFTDLCRGPHVDTVKELKYFKLIKFSGAYFKGDSKNKMLQRIYGVCFKNEEDLNDYLNELEEAKLRDHRKIGKEQELYMNDELVGSGMPLWLPNGAIIRKQLENYIYEKEQKLGYLHVYTPCVGTVNLYKTSGHWDHYKENMFPLMKVDEEEFNKVVKLILEVYKDFGIKNYKFRLSLRDIDDKEKYYDDDSMWDIAENKLREVLDNLKIDYYEAIGEAAFYGPKLDVEVKPAVGPEVTLSTCQLDFLLPKNFELNYIDCKGEKQTPVVIHRAILGTFDRFTAFIIEETKGFFPLWLAPKQVIVIPVNNEYHLDYSKKIYNELINNSIRVELDDREEKLSYKMRESQTKKIPYTIIVGDKEIETNSVSYRIHGSKDTITLEYKEFINKILKESKL